MPRVDLGLIPEIEVIPHYDKFLGWVPDRIASIALRSDEGTYLLGIDEDTALVLTDTWRVQGRSKYMSLRDLQIHHTLLPAVMKFLYFTLSPDCDCLRCLHR